MKVPYTKLSIPLESMKYLLLQRTEYQRIQNNILVKLLSRFSFASTSLSVKKKQVEGLLRKREIEREFSHDIYTEYHEMAPFIGQNTSTVLDIGCGLACIDVFLFKHLNGNAKSISLLDKTLIDTKIHYNFENKGAFYNSLDLAKKILNKNGVRPEYVYLYDTTQISSIENKTFDLIISLISWGFHYPVSTYLEFVNSITHETSRLILDVRKGTDGKTLLSQKFPYSQLISETADKQRLVFSKSPLE